MAVVEQGDAGAISEELGRDSSTGRERSNLEELAAFAISTQGLSALVARAGGLNALPAALSDFLFAESLLSRARANRLLETLNGVVRALRGASVEVISLKGAALACFHYPDPALRPMGDLDLLLHDPRDLARATEALAGAGWRALFDTPRHRVFARPDERIARPAAEDPDNPIRVEIHTSFRIPVLGRVYDASAELRTQAETRDLGGTPVSIAAGPALLRHLLFHAAEDFAGNGIRGIQAYDFRLLAQNTGSPLAPERPAHGVAPLLYAADAIERLFALTFKESFLSSLSSRVSPILRARAAALPALRYTRPARGWTRTLLTLIDRPLPKARFLVRTVFPGLGEVRANAAPGATGFALAAAWTRVLARRIVQRATTMARAHAEGARARVLAEGAFFAHERFGAEAVNRGAVLWECEWDGGAFESGVMLGGIFRAGTFDGGVAWAVYWKGGAWTGGLWHHGFGPDGSYRPRGAFPGSVLSEASAPVSPIEKSAIPRVTVFAASVFGDVPRLWLACLSRCLPPADVAFEVFDDSEENSLDGRLLPGVSVLRRCESRPDFQIAYGDALWRATTPLLAFVDTDVLWLSRDVWPRILREFGNPRVAAVSCVSRAEAESPGTFAVVMRTEVYRDVVARVPGAFAPFVEGEKGGGLPGRCRGDDTGDRVARAVKEAGFDVPLLHLDGTGAFARFDAITMTRLLGGWVGPETLLEMAVTNAYFRRGCLGALALARVHDRVFADGPRFGVPLSAARLWGRLLRHPRALANAVREAAEIRRAAGGLRRFLTSPQGAAPTSA